MSSHWSNFSALVYFIFNSHLPLEQLANIFVFKSFFLLLGFGSCVSLHLSGSLCGCRCRRAALQAACAPIDGITALDFSPLHSAPLCCSNVKGIGELKIITLLKNIYSVIKKNPWLSFSDTYVQSDILKIGDAFTFHTPNMLLIIPPVVLYCYL